MVVFSHPDVADVRVCPVPLVHVRMVSCDNLNRYGRLWQAGMHGHALARPCFGFTCCNITLLKRLLLTCLGTLAWNLAWTLVNTPAFVGEWCGDVCLP